MDLPVMDGVGATPAYDYRLYDRIWQRVSPDLVPYPELREEDNCQGSAAGGLAAPRREGGEAPGNGEEGCCLGEAALPSLETLEEFFAMELAESRCFRALASRVCRRDARDLLRRMADEKCRAARHLAAACYLLTGRCPNMSVAVERRRWPSLAQALRSCWHQESCNGLRYQQAAAESGDRCLEELLKGLSRQSYRRAEEILSLLGDVIC